MNQTKILAVPFANAGIAECVEYAMQQMEQEGASYVVAPDSVMMHELQKNKRLRNAVYQADLILPAGNGIVVASRILGTPIHSRVPVLDFSSALLARMGEKGMRVFLLGEEYETVELARENLSQRYPGLKLSSGDTVYYANEDDLTDVISQEQPDLLLVSMESPRQEQWLCRMQERTQAGLMLGIGENLKVYAGQMPIAPKAWRDSGFDWLYWILREPKRLVRVAKQAWILYAALWRRLFGN